MNSRDEVKSDPRRSLPAVDRVVRALEGIASGLPVWTLREAAREVLDAERARLGATSGSPAAATEQDLIAAAATRARDLARPHPQSLINATGILLHTNLGRAPLAPGAARAVELAARTYGDLELDLDTGERGSRGAAVEHKLRLLTGGSFRVPDNMASAGVRLVEVGTTNRTHLRDYESAIDGDTALLLKVHRSN